MTDSIKPIFIGGMPHSGTSITRKVLKEHPRVTAMEAEFRALTDPGGLLDLIPALSKFGSWTRNKGDRAVGRVLGLLRTLDSRVQSRPYTKYEFDNWFTEEYQQRIDDLEEELAAYTIKEGGRFGYPPQRAKSYLTEPFLPKDLREIIRDFVKGLYLARSSNAERFAEDTPENLVRADELSQVFPDAQFVHVHRHPLDVVSSLRGTRRNGYWREGLPGGENIEGTAHRYVAYIKKWWSIQSGIPDDQWIEVNFEDFVSNHRYELKKLCKGLDIDWTDQLLPNRLDEDRAHIGRHQNDMTEEEQDSIREIVKPLLEVYDRDGSSF